MGAKTWHHTSSQSYNLDQQTTTQSQNTTHNKQQSSSKKEILPIQQTKTTRRRCRLQLTSQQIYGFTPRGYQLQAKEGHTTTSYENRSPSAAPHRAWQPRPSTSIFRGLGETSSTSSSSFYCLDLYTSIILFQVALLNGQWSLQFTRWWSLKQS